MHLIGEFGAPLHFFIDENGHLQSEIIEEGDSIDGGFRKSSGKSKGEWVIGVAYEMLDMVTHNLNLYIALKRYCCGADR